MYKLIRSILFLFDAEKVHHFSFAFISFIHKIPGIKAAIKSIFTQTDVEVKLWDLTFKNNVGLAAGFDKDGKLINQLANFGFGFIEIGTITPLPQPGNEKPRLFRLKKDEAIINRMGFNNEGVDAAVNRLKNKTFDVLIGGNIGKNKWTENKDAAKDYEICFLKLAPYVDYFVINVSSPNTPGLRALQDKEPLTALLTHIILLNNELNKPRPVLLKIAPDLSIEQLDDIIEIVNLTKIHGVIATNTTIKRENLHETSSIKTEIGGLSGKPLCSQSTEVIRYLHQKSKAAFPIIGVGGIHSAQDALDKINAGASLVQLYTGFIYEGPALIQKINKAINSSVR